MENPVMVSIICVLFGAVFAAIGAFSWRGHKRRLQVCTMQTAGIVSDIDHKVEYSTERDSDRRKSRSRTDSYYPIFSYTVNNLEYIKRSSTGTGRPRFAKNAPVTVFYNPADPNEYYVAEDKANARIGPIFTAAGVVIVILGIIVPFLAQ